MSKPRFWKGQVVLDKICTEGSVSGTRQYAQIRQVGSTGIVLENGLFRLRSEIRPLTEREIIPHDQVKTD